MEAASHAVDRVRIRSTSSVQSGPLSGYHAQSCTLQPVPAVSQRAVWVVTPQEKWAGCLRAVSVLACSPCSPFAPREL